MSQFYEACGIDDVSRRSVLCLYAASFGGAVFTATTLVVCAKTDDPGGCRGDTVWIVTLWRHPVASNVAHDVLHWVMCLVLQRWIAKAITTASEGGAFVCHCRFVVVHNLSYYTILLWLTKNKAKPHYCSLLCFSLAHIVWDAAGNNGCRFGHHCSNVRAQFWYQIEVATNKLSTRIMYYILLNPSTAASANTSDGSTLRWIERTH